MFDILAKGDITKFDEIADTNYILCLNQLMLLKYKNDIEEYHHKQNMKNIK